LLACGGRVNSDADAGSSSGGSSGSSGSGSGSGAAAEAGGGSGGTSSGVTVPLCPIDPPIPGAACGAPGAQGCIYLGANGCRAFVCDGTWQTTTTGC
jgi:hypothetical protein